jgi:hypothetical protein
MTMKMKIKGRRDHQQKNTFLCSLVVNQVYSHNGNKVSEGVKEFHVKWNVLAVRGI